MISFLIHFSVFAQKKKIKFQSINQFAMVGGENQINSSFQTINGITFSDWFSGIGIGIDNYRYKTLPLFVEGKWFFENDKRGFIYGDMGYNFPMKNKPGKEVDYYNTYNFTGGVYTDIGIGFRVHLYKKSSLQFSLGYSYKKMSTNIGVNICPFAGPCYVDYSKYDFSFNRIVLKAGFVF